ncbi:MAG: signal peptidase I [Candidatus Nanopelagicales bacterium]|nr:signal peptidase I [Candidatus Nanopelagicales bacterium]
MAVSARDDDSVPQLPEPVAGGRHRKGERKEAKGGALHFFRETAIIVVSALVLSALVRAFLIQAFYVPSASMEETLLPNDRIIAAKITTRISGVQRGEIMVFRDPGGWLPTPEPAPSGARSYLRTALTFIGLIPSDSGQDLVKRAIGVAGDRVACCDEQGRIVLNGVPLDESYVTGPTDQVRFDIVVPADSMFMMGDKRDNSRDSRYHLDVNNGGVPQDAAVGRTVLTIWPLDRFSVQPIPEIFGNPAIARGAPD